MRKVGSILLAIGILLIIYNLYHWQIERNNVEPLDLHKITSQKNEFSKKNSFQTGEEIAKLLIPSVDKSYPVFLGTDPDILKKGAGLYKSKWTTYPSNGGHTVISGHRDTIFRDLSHVEKGNILLLSFQGKLYRYQVQRIWITDKDDRTVIVKKEQPTLTLTTCYPFSYVGHAPKRYIIQAVQQKDVPLTKGT